MTLVFDYLNTQCEQARLSDIDEGEIKSKLTHDNSMPYKIKFLRILRAIETLDKNDLTDDEKRKIDKIKESYNYLTLLCESKFIFDDENNTTETKVENKFYRDLLNSYINEDQLSDKVINLIAFLNDSNNPDSIKNEIKKLIVNL